MENLKKELKEMIITELRLRNMTPDDIGDDELLFGDGIGLDSLDAVELVVLLQKRYGVQVADTEEGKKVLRSINTMADFISERRNKS